MYSHEMNMLAGLDARDLRMGSKMTGKSVNNINMMLKQLGIQNDKVNIALTSFSAALKITTGVMGLITLAHAKTIAKTVTDRMRLAAEISINSAMGPPGWAKIAIGAVAALTISLGLAYIVKKVMVGRYDLSSPIERNKAVIATQGAIANV